VSGPLLQAISGLGQEKQRRFPEFKPPMPLEEFAERGEVLESAFYWLDLLARMENITSLMTFCDMRPVPGGMRKWLKMLEKKSALEVVLKMRQAMDKASGPWVDWYPAAQGIAAVADLLARLQQGGWQQVTARIGQEFPGLPMKRFAPATETQVITELTALAADLRKAHEVGAQFRLLLTSPLLG
jgi:hypothetical protein